MKAKLFFIGIWFCFTTNGIAQTSLVFDSTKINIGKIASYVPSAIQYDFYNNSDQSIEWEQIPNDDQIYVQVDHQVILPYQKSRITVFYFTQKLGKFTKKWEMATKHQEIYTLSMEGDITAFSSENLNSNPSINKYQETNYPSVSGDKNIKFVLMDIHTMKPIPYMKLLLEHTKSKFQFIGVTDQNGLLENKIPDGQYSIYCLQKQYNQDINFTKIDEINNKVYIFVSKQKGNQNDRIFLKKSNLGKNEFVSTIDTFKMLKDTPTVPLFKKITLFVLIDISTSMNKNDRIGLLKENLYQLIDSIDPMDRLVILGFNETTQLILDSKTMNSIDDQKNSIQSIKLEGNTNGVLAIQTLINKLQEFSDDSSKAMILLATDGKITGNSHEDRIILNQIVRLNQNQMLFSVIGFGNSIYESQKLEKMAELGGGLYLSQSDIMKRNKTIVNDIYSTLRLLHNTP